MLIMATYIEFQVGRLRALLSLLTSKSFMIGIDEYREYLTGFVKQLITVTKTIRRFLENSNLKDVNVLLDYIEKLEGDLSEYSTIISDTNIKAEDLFNISSEKLTQIINYSNDFMQQFREVDDYHPLIEEVYFLKNRLFETERIEKSFVPIIKQLKEKLGDDEKKISALTEQLDQAEKKIFETQTELSRVTDERDSLQDRIQEIIGQKTFEGGLIFEKEALSNLKNENIELKQKIKSLSAKLASKGTLEYEYEDKRKDEALDKLERQLEEAKERYLKRISTLTEERNVWRSRSLQAAALNVDEALARLKSQINEFEKQNRSLIEENERLQSEIKKFKDEVEVSQG